MTQDSLYDEKQALRRKMREALRALPQEELVRQSDQACEGICTLPAYQRAETVLAYMAMNHECSPALAVEAARKAGKSVAFPLCGPEYSLRLLIPRAAGAFQKGSYGIWEPVPELCVEIDPQKLDFIILPGLAFDRAFNRLGQGAGYYDRLLPKTGAFLAGLGLDFQMVERVPAGPLDVPLDAVSLPGGLCRR